MIPYIAILILLISVILWQVYSQTESFTGNTPFNPIVLTESSTNRDLLDNISKVVAKLYDLKGMYAGKMFTPKPTVDEATLLQYTITKDASGKQTIQGDTSADALRKKLDDELKIYEEQLTNAQNDMKIGAVRLDAKVVDRVLADSTLTKDQATSATTEILKMLNANNDLLAKKFGAFESIYYREYPAPTPVAPTTTTTTASTTVVPKTTTSTPPTTTTTKAPSSFFSMLSTKLAKAQDASGAEINIDLTKTKENVICSQPEPTGKPTPEFTKEMEERLAKRVSTEIKNQLASNYQLQGALEDMSPNAPCDTEAIAQGAEYVGTQSASQQLPDMSKYVKKDSIPCWGCTLDF